jgi:hypothetical protein
MNALHVSNFFRRCALSCESTSNIGQTYVAAEAAGVQYFALSISIAIRAIFLRKPDFETLVPELLYLARLLYHLTPP